MGQFLTPKEAADFMHLSPWTLLKMRKQCRGPRYVRVEQRRIMYDVDDIVSYLVSKKVETVDTLLCVQGGRAA